MKSHYRFRHKNRLLRILNLSGRWQCEWAIMSKPINAHRGHQWTNRPISYHQQMDLWHYQQKCIHITHYHIYIRYMRSINHMEQRAKVNVIIDSINCLLWQEASNHRKILCPDRLEFMCMYGAGTCEKQVKLPRTTELNLPSLMCSESVITIYLRWIAKNQTEHAVDSFLFVLFKLASITLIN